MEKDTDEAAKKKHTEIRQALQENKNTAAKHGRSSQGYKVKGKRKNKSKLAWNMI